MPVPTAVPLTELANRLAAWASSKTGRVADVVGEPSIPPTNGMQAPTVLFDLRWRDTHETERFVLRGDIDADLVPAFDTRALETQYLVLRALAAQAAMVPTVRWYEPDPSWIGTAFFVMDRVAGVVPADQPPYVLGGWVTELSAPQRAQLEAGTVAAVASIHGVGLAPVLRELGDAAAGMSLSAAVALERVRQRYEWGRGTSRSRLIEEMIAWCAERIPSDETPPVLCWGDARVGNLMFDDGRPVAILDWDSAAIGPREFDVAWMIVFHAMFQDVATTYGFPGLPDMFVRERVIGAYEAATGVAVAPLPVYEALGALKLAAGSLRGHHLEIYGRTEATPLDERFSHAALMRRMLSGEYWGA